MNVADTSSSEVGPPSTPGALLAVLELQRAALIRDGPPPLAQRRADLAKLKSAIKSNAERIARVIESDFGCRSKRETLLTEVYRTTESIRHASRCVSKWMRPKRVSVSFSLLPGRAWIMHQPLGVVGIISPWNQPFYLSFAPLVAALAAGNRVMLKPSELTPRTAEFIADFLANLFPCEKVATVLGGPDIAAAFSHLPFNHLLYTGSAAVGRRVMEAAAENLTPVTLELGGKSPCILDDDAVRPSAVESLFHGKLVNAGQTCIAPDYVLVPEAKLDEFLNLCAKAVAKLYPSIKASPDYTAIINDDHYGRITSYIREARARGLVVLELNPARETFESRDRKLAPTLILQPTDDLAVMREEIFGPVLPVKTYRHLKEAIDYINRHPRPLALYHFGSDAKKRDEVLQFTTSGGASVNTTMLHAVVENLPFGGVGASGMGAYNGEFGFQTFSHRKGVFLQSHFNWSRAFRPPFGPLYQWFVGVLKRL